MCLLPCVLRTLFSLVATAKYPIKMAVPMRIHCQHPYHHLFSINGSFLFFSKLASTAMQQCYNRAAVKGDLFLSLFLYGLYF